MNDVECPYCGAGQDICHDDGYGYEEDKTHQQECTQCEKTFTYQTSISFYYSAKKADCLNGALHKFDREHNYSNRHTVAYCRDCGHERYAAVPQTQNDEGSK